MDSFARTSIRVARAPEEGPKALELAVSPRTPSAVTYLGPVLLTPAYTLADFSAGAAALDEWLVRRALASQASGTSRTWVVTQADSRQVIAFYASSTASVLRSEAPKLLQRNQPDELPAILLARLAVDLRHRGRGLAAALLKHFFLKARDVSESVGVHLVLVHAKDNDAGSFYEHLGFIQSPMDPYTLMLRVPRVP
jgi:GNAT superfamily N-acetyltransferase